MKWAAMQEQSNALRQRWAAQAERDARRPEIDAFAPPSAKVPHGTNDGVRGGGNSEVDQTALAELTEWARTVRRICGPRLFGEVPEGFVGPPVSGRPKLSRLA